MPYVDGYVLPVPVKHLKAYRALATKAGKVWRKHGALEYRECSAEDLTVQKGIVPFAKAIKAKPDEIVIFAYVVFKSRAHRDSVNAKVFKDPLMNDPTFKKKMMAFDMKRMAYGGFTVMVDA